MKKIAGQHKNEKILYFTRENLISYIVRNYNFIFLIFWWAIFLMIFLYFLQFNVIIIVLIISLYLLIVFLIIFYIWYKSYFIITNKRLIKYVRNWLFSEHIKELKIDQLNELISNKKWILEKVFNFGNIKITWKSKENVIWVIWINLPDEVVQYVSRLRDYILDNPWYDFNELKEFKSRKERKY